MSDAREALPAAEGDAVEKAARAWHEAAEAMDDEGPQMGPWDDLDPHDRDRARRYMRAALGAAGVGALRAEVERLRAGIEALATEGEAWGRGVAVELSKRLRALLAGSGEQPGEVDGYCTCHDDQKGRTRDCGVKDHREAGRPVVPDSADVRERVRGAVKRAATWTEDGPEYEEAPDAGMVEEITDAVLAVVGQGVTADIPERLRRAVARLEEKRDDLRKPDMFERARLNGKIEGVKLAASYIEEGERIFRAAVRPSGQEGS